MIISLMTELDQLLYDGLAVVQSKLVHATLFMVMAIIMRLT